MRHYFSEHFRETLQRRYGIKLTDEIREKLINNIVTNSKPYKRNLKGRLPGRLVYVGDLLFEYIAVAYDPKTHTFVSALRLGVQ
jgi:hypothetical protein